MALKITIRKKGSQAFLRKIKPAGIVEGKKEYCFVSAVRFWILFRPGSLIYAS
jgi:hypothetical protein